MLGAGNMGTALAFVLAQNGHSVDIWNWEGEQQPLCDILETHENKKYLPGILLPKKIQPVFDLAHAVAQKKIIFLCVSTVAMKSVVKNCAKYLAPGTILVDVSKGLDPQTGKTIPQIIQALTKKNKTHIVGISGPAVASQMVAGEYTALVLGGENKKACVVVQQVLQNAFLKLEIADDVQGVEYVQTLKNVYALGLGIVEGIGFGKNTQAIFFAEAVKEMMQILEWKKCNPETVLGLCGIGDLFTTSQSTEGRNRQCGLLVGKGDTVHKAMREVCQTVEGYTALITFYKMLGTKANKLRFFSFIYSVVEKKVSSEKALKKFFA